MESTSSTTSGCTGFAWAPRRAAPPGDAVMKISHDSPPPRDADTFLPRLREAAAHTLIYGLGSVLQTALGLILIPLYTRQFTPDLYGVLTLLTLAGTVAGAIFYLGSTSALARSYYDYDHPDDRRMVVGTSLRLSLAGAGLQMLLALAGGPLISRAFFGTDRYAWHIVAALASSALTFVNAVFLMVLRFHRRSVQLVVLNLGALVATTAFIVYLLIGRRLGVMAPLLGTLGGQAVLLLALVAATREHVSLRWSARELRVQLAFGLPSVLIGLTYYTLDSADRVFIQRFLGLADVGVYSLGYRLGMLIQILLVLPFSQIWGPMRMEYRGDPKAPRLFGTVLTYYLMVGLWLATAIALFAPELVRLLVGHPEYYPAARVVPFIVLGHLAYGAVNIVDSGIIFSRRVFYHVFIFLGALGLNTTLNIWLVPRIGYLGAAYATVASYVAVAAAAAWVSDRLFPLSWETGRLVKVIVLGVGVLAASASLGTGWLSAAAKAGLLVVLALGWYRRVLSDEERSYLQRGLRTLRFGPRAITRGA